MTVPYFFNDLDARGRAVVHARTIVSMLAFPEKRIPGTFGEQWYEEALDTLDKIGTTEKGEAYAASLQSTHQVIRNDQEIICEQ